MSSFNGQELFSSGPHRLEIGGVSLRHAVHETPGSQGVQITGQGRGARSIVQTGDLLADSMAALRTLITAIESMVDGRPYVLLDDYGESWPNTVMTEVAPVRINRVGPRYHAWYRIEYLQIIL